MWIVQSGNMWFYAKFGSRLTISNNVVQGSLQRGLIKGTNIETANWYMPPMNCFRVFLSWVHLGGLISEYWVCETLYPNASYIIGVCSILPRRGKVTHIQTLNSVASSVSIFIKKCAWKTITLSLLTCGQSSLQTMYQTEHSNT